MTDMSAIQEPTTIINIIISIIIIIIITWHFHLNWWSLNDLHILYKAWEIALF